MHSCHETSPHLHTYRIDNHYDFLSTDHIALQWRLVVDGAPVDASLAALLLPPTDDGPSPGGSGLPIPPTSAAIPPVEDDQRFWSPPVAISPAIGPRSHAHHMLPLTLAQAMTVAGRYQVSKDPNVDDFCARSHASDCFYPLVPFFFPQDPPFLGF